MGSLAREFGDPGTEANPLPDDAYEAEHMAADDAVSPQSGPAEELPGGEPAERTDLQTNDSETHMTEQTEELRARLSEKDDRIAELESEVEQLQDERQDVAQAYAESLAAGDSIFNADELVDKFEVAELREKFDATETATMADVEPDVQSGGANTETATLSDSEAEEVAEHREVIAELAGSDAMVAKKERERRAEIVAEKTGEDTETVLGSN
jgi:TolA-binding protein